MKYRLRNEAIRDYNESINFTFPKYTSQIINLANQNAQGTRASVVGQMSELFPEFLESGEPITIESWRRWYTERHPRALKDASAKICAQVDNLRAAIAHIDRKLVCEWVEDLVINKTFNGLYVQRAILTSLAERKGTAYRLATPEEESRGIDGWVGGEAYSIEPDSYKTMQRLPEAIDVKMIYYTKTSIGLTLDVEE